MSRKKIPHFRLYIDDFLTGTKDMSAAIVGDYIRLLCAIYDQDGRLLFDPFALRHILGCSRAADVTQRVMRLVVIGKLNLSREGLLSNGRADKEIKKRHDFQVENPAVKGAVKPQGKPQVSYPKKPTKTKGAVHSRAQPRTSSGVPPTQEAGHAAIAPLLSVTSAQTTPVQKQKNGDVSDPQALGALGLLDGRAPSPAFEAKEQLH